MVINFTYRHKNNFFQSGFGLIELMVSISVMVLVISVILVNHNSYNGATLLRSQAYEIALQLREAQLMSISATQAEVGLDFRNVYGVHFSLATNDTYFIFRDENGDYFFDAGAEELGKQGTLDSHFTIDAIRLIGSVVVPEQLSVTFERPNFDAKFRTASGVSPAGLTGVEIDVRTKGTVGLGSGKLRTIEITKAGQITVK